MTDDSIRFYRDGSMVEWLDNRGVIHTGRVIERFEDGGENFVVIRKLNVQKFIVLSMSTGKVVS